MSHRACALAFVLIALLCTACNGCRTQPAVRLTYQVDVAAAYDGSKNVDAVMSATRTTVARRLDAVFGRRGAWVTTHGQELVVELGALDADQMREVRSIIATSGRLEFKIVEDSVDFFQKIEEADLPDGEGISIYREQAPNGLGPDGKPVLVTTSYARMALRPDKHASETMEDCRQRLEAWAGTLDVPADREVGLMALHTVDPATHATTDEGWRTFYLFRRAELTGDSIAEASMLEKDKTEGAERYSVMLTFNAAGASAFERLTEANVKRRFAILIGGIVDSAPVIQSKIGGGHASITMGAGPPEKQLEDARRLELTLRMGALPAPLRLLKEEALRDGGR